MTAIIELYIEYYNNFLTIQGFADYYGIDQEDAKTILELGKKYNNKKAKQDTKTF